jgi:general secretion pathway protein A
MYTTYFGLQKLPFNLTPDPAFLFLSSKHREVLAGLTYAISDRKGFAVLTGDAGTGKTTLLNSVLDRLSTARIESSVILNPTLTASEFLETVLLDFDIPDVPASKAQRLWKLQEFLTRTHHQNRVAVLVVDEAHKLSLDVLEEIRLLGNLEGGADKYLQILLLGQSELDDLLNRQDLRQFRQRIALRMSICPLTADQVSQYIAFRWAKAGGKDASPFTRDAVNEVTEWSAGIPRLINSICDTALLMAYGEQSSLVGMHYVREAARSLILPGALRLPMVPRPVSTISQPTAVVSTEKVYASTRSEAHSCMSSDLPDEDLGLPTLSKYTSRASSSLLKRLADRFGIGH